jgi:hypothetical protein
MYYLMQSNALIFPSKQSSAMRKTGMLKRHKCIRTYSNQCIFDYHNLFFEIKNQILVKRADIKADAHLNLCGFKHVLYYRTELYGRRCATLTCYTKEQLETSIKQFTGKAVS